MSIYAETLLEMWPNLVLVVENRQTTWAVVLKHPTGSDVRSRCGSTVEAAFRNLHEDMVKEAEADAAKAAEHVTKLIGETRASGTGEGEKR